METMEKDPNRPFSWEEEDKKLAEARERSKESIDNMELLINAIESWQNKEINVLIVKYANGESLDTNQFYQYFINELKAYLYFLELSYERTGQPLTWSYLENKRIEEQMFETLMHFWEFEEKYSELIRFDLLKPSEIPATSEKTKTDVKEALPKE